MPDINIQTKTYVRIVDDPLQPGRFRISIFHGERLIGIPAHDLGRRESREMQRVVRFTLEYALELSRDIMAEAMGAQRVDR